MKIRFALVSLALALSPALAAAECPMSTKSSASICAAGQMFDTQTNRCITTPSS